MLCLLGDTEHSVSTVHHTLSSWREGLGATVLSIVQYRRRSLIHFTALAFFVSMSILHITTPSVITIRSVSVIHFVN